MYETRRHAPNKIVDFGLITKNELNCTLISVYENGPMTLRQIAERLGISFAVKQIETRL